MFNRFIVTVTFALSFAIFLSGSVNGQSRSGEIAEISNNGSDISWRIKVPHESVTLTVATPDGNVFRREFRSGTTPVFPLLTKSGESYSDGGFTYELVITPILDPDVKADMLASRENGDSEEVAADLKRRGLLTEGAKESGSFRVLNGQAYTKNDGPVEPEPLRSETGSVEPDTKSGQGSKSGNTGSESLAPGDQVILDDLIVDGSICAGLDCVNGESFGFDTLRLKENNLRIRAFDTSTSASFPTRDWQITFNESSNGGLEKFSIDDIDGGRIPFTIEAGARTNALYVEADGDIGIGTNNPVGDLHIKTGNTPTLRLEQDGSNGFTAQTWDIAGNEANFFIRDATNGSTLPFRVYPGQSSDSLVLRSSGVGFGTNSPDARAHVIGALIVDKADYGGLGDANVNMAVRDLADSRVQIELQSQNSNWQVIAEDDGAANRGLSFTRVGTAARELRITNTGELIISGTTMNVPDYVFEPEYKLMSLDELGEFIRKNKHLPNVQSAADVKANGLDLGGMTLRLLEKIEELTLYTINQKEAFELEIAKLKAEIEELKTVGKSAVDK